MSNEVRPPIDIGGASKSRPGPLDPDENRPRPVPQSSIQRGGGSSGGTSWMPAIIAIVVSVIASAVMVFMFNPAKAGVETLSNQVIQLDQRMSTMEGYATKIDKIDDIDTSLNQLLATSAGYVTQSDLAGITDGMADEGQISNLQASIDALNITNADLLARLEALEEEETSNGSSTISDTIRWRFEDPVLLTSVGNPVALVTGQSFYKRVDTSRIQEEGSYYLDLVMENSSGINWDIEGNFRMEIALKPYTSSDYAMLSEDTFLDTDDSPSMYKTVPLSMSYPSWDSTFETRTREGQEVIRRITFTSNRLSALTLEDGGSVVISLVLELYYE